MRKLDRGITLSPRLTLPIEAITNTFAIFGIRGSGKSNLAAVMAEGIIKAGQPVCVIDPTGAWHGLKSSRDGKSAGLPVYVFGGEHADMPLEPTAGDVLADFVVTQRMPTVLDLKLMRKHEQIKFVLAFAEAVYHRNREPLMVFIDEVSRFAPQQIKDKAPEAARCLGAMEDLATLGRNNGIGVVIIGQRPAPVSTTLRTQVENLICLRTIGKHDRKAIDEWVEAKGTQAERDEMMKDLATLPDGTGYFWSPAWMHRFSKEHFLLRETFDSGATPKIGQRRIEPKAFAEIDKTKLSADIVATIERAKATDPRELEKKIAELKKQLAAKPAAAPAPPKEIPAERLQAQYEKGVLAERKRIRKEIGPQLKAAHREAADTLPVEIEITRAGQPSFSSKGIGIGVISALEKAIAALDAAIPVEPEPHIAPKIPPRPVDVQGRPLSSTGGGPFMPPPLNPPRKPTASVNPDPNFKIGKCETAILSVLAQHQEGCESNRLALLAGYSYTGSFRNSLGGLRKEGLIQGENTEKMRITDMGLGSVTYEALPEGAELRRYWMEHPRFGKCERAILQVLFNDRTPMTGPEVAAKTIKEDDRAYEYTGSFRNSLGMLRTAGLITGDSNMVPFTAAPELF